MRLLRVDGSLFHRANRDEDAITVRNAGGRTEFAIRDLLVLDTLAGLTDVLVLHHTGMSGYQGT